MSCNRTQLCGRLETRGMLRFSPAGIALVKFTIAHRSEQQEAGASRKSDCTVRAVAAGEVAQNIAQLPAHAQVSVSGFLAQASRTDSALVLHVQNFEWIE